MSLAALGGIAAAQISQPTPKEKPAPPANNDPRGLLTSPRVMCKFNIGGEVLDIMFEFSHWGSGPKDPAFRPNFYGVPKETDENLGEILNDRQDGNSRKFLAMFKTGWEVEFTLTGDRKIVSGTPRRGDQTGTAKLEGDRCF